MPFINHLNFAEVHETLIELLDNREQLDLHEDDRAMLENARKIFDDAKEYEASEGLMELANDIYGTDEVEIQNPGAGTSPTDEGIWVQAWVWVSQDKLVEAGLRETEDEEEVDED